MQYELVGDVNSLACGHSESCSYTISHRPVGRWPISSDLYLEMRETILDVWLAWDLTVFLSYSFLKDILNAILLLLPLRSIQMLFLFLAPKHWFFRLTKQQVEGWQEIEIRVDHNTSQVSFFNNIRFQWYIGNKRLNFSWSGSTILFSVDSFES